MGGVTSGCWWEQGSFLLHLNTLQKKDSTGDALVLRGPMGFLSHHCLSASISKAWLSSLHGKHQSRASAASSSHTWALWCSESSGEDPWCSSSGIEDISSGKKGSDSTCSVPPTLQTAKTSQAQVRAHVVLYLSHLCVPRKPQTRPGHMGYQ